MLTLAFIHLKKIIMEAKKTTKQYNTILSQAKKGVPGFTLAYGKFIEKVTIGQNSKSAYRQLQP
ncbi:MAG: hypothetical protein NVS3B8_14040 [Chitinophagaceae bacterium]